MTVEHVRFIFNLVGLSTDTKPDIFDGQNVGPGSTFFEKDTDSTYKYDGNSWNQKSISGAALVAIKRTDLTIKQSFMNLLGSGAATVPNNFTALPTGAGAGPDTYAVDLTDFHEDEIYLVVLLATGAALVTATVDYTQDGIDSARLRHPETPVSLIAGVAGNNSVLIPKKDNFCFITLSLNVAENMWAYVVGREKAETT